MTKYLLLFLFAFFLYQPLSGQYKFTNQIGLGLVKNDNILEDYAFEGLVNTVLTKERVLPNFTFGVFYNFTVDYNRFFLRTGLNYSRNKLKASPVDQYTTIGIPITVGLKYWKFRLFAGLENNFNFYKYSYYSDIDFQINETNCLCTVNKFYVQLPIGLEYEIYRFNIGLIVNAYPKKVLIVDGLGRLDKTNDMSVYISYDF